ncbi:MAG: hypothetical protein DMG08_02715 [Acidobacteria bacterium]|nr:MAG: hypothetical protein DMG08_02715 [Acidobacteriota bacterium]
MILRRGLFYILAGLLHVWTLLSIFAFFYFPVFLDSRAVHGPPRNSLPWAAVLLLLLAGPVYLLLNSSFVGARVLPHSYQPMRSFTPNLFAVDQTFAIPFAHFAPSR